MADSLPPLPTEAEAAAMPIEADLPPLPSEEEAAALEVGDSYEGPSFVTRAKKAISGAVEAIAPAAKSVAKEAVADLEAGANLASSFAAFPIATAATAGALSQPLMAGRKPDLEQAREAFEKTSKAFTYEPRTELGKERAELVQTPMAKLGELSTAAGEKAADIARPIVGDTGAEVVGAVTEATVGMAPVIAGVEAVKGGSRVIQRRKVNTKIDAVLQEGKVNPELAKVIKAHAMDHASKKGAHPDVGAHINAGVDALHHSDLMALSPGYRAYIEAGGEEGAARDALKSQLRGVSVRVAPPDEVDLDKILLEEEKPKTETKASSNENPERDTGEAPRVVPAETDAEAAAREPVQRAPTRVEGVPVNVAPPEDRPKWLAMARDMRAMADLAAKHGDSRLENAALRRMQEALDRAGFMEPEPREKLPTEGLRPQEVKPTEVKVEPAAEPPPEPPEGAGMRVEELPVEDVTPGAPEPPPEVWSESEPLLVGGMDGDVAKAPDGTWHVTLGENRLPFATGKTAKAARQAANRRALKLGKTGVADYVREQEKSREQQLRAAERQPAEQQVSGERAVPADQEAQAGTPPAVGEAAQRPEGDRNAAPAGEVANAPSGIREDQGQPQEAGRVGEAGESDGSPRLEQAPPGRPEPLESRAQGDSHEAIQERLKSEKNRATLQHMANESGWAEVGGYAELVPGTGKFSHRTTWVPQAPWFPEVQRGVKMPGKAKVGKAYQEAARKALAGEKMSAVERRAVKGMLDHADLMDRLDREHYEDQQRQARLDEHDAAAMDSHGLDHADESVALDHELAKQVEQMDPAAFERLAKQHENSTNEQFNKALQEFVDEHRSEVAAGPEVEANRGAAEVLGGEGSRAEPGAGQEAPALEGSPEYRKAYDEHNAAIREFNKARDAYRARQIGDDEFLAARAKYDEATKKFDEAFAAEQKRPSLELKPTTPEGLKAEEEAAAKRERQAEQDKANAPERFTLEAQGKSKEQQAEERNRAAQDEIPFQRTSEVRHGMLPKVVRKIIDNTTRFWKNIPEIVVHDSFEADSVHPDVRAEHARQVARGAKGEPAAWVHGGQIHINAKAMRDTRAVIRAVYHESVGHKGLHGAFGDEANAVLDRVWKQNEADVRAAAEREGLDVKDERQRRIAAEEVLADLAERDPKLNIVREAVVWARGLIRKHLTAYKGMRFTDDELIKNIIMPAKRWVQDGGARGAFKAEGVRFARDEKVTKHRVVAVNKDTGERFVVNSNLTRKQAEKIADEERRKDAWSSDSFLIEPYDDIRFQRDEDVLRGADDKPLTVFHGTPVGDIKKFDTKRGGIFFSSDPKVASDYTSRRGMWRSSGGSGAVYPVNLRMKNPLVIDALGKRNDNIPVPWQQWKPKVFGNLPENAVSVEAALKYAKEHGHDGLIVKNVVDTADITEKHKSDVYAVVDSSQVASPFSDDIRFQRAEQPTSIKNEIVARERDARGFPEAQEAAKRGFGEVWESAQPKTEADFRAINDLVEELKEKPRAVTDKEDAQLLHRQISLHNEYDRLASELASAYESGDLATVAEKRVQAARVSDDLLDLYDINKRVGTETARGLNARKILANADFSLAAMETRAREAVGGRKLTEQESAEVRKANKRIKETEDALDEHLQKSAGAQTKTGRVLNGLKEAMQKRLNEMAPSRERAELQQEFNNIFGRKKLTDEQRLAMAKKRFAKSVQQWENRVAIQQFEPVPRNKIPLDAEALRLKAAAEEAKVGFLRAAAEWRNNRRTLPEKAQDWLVKWRRAFLLSSPITLAKLTSAAVQRLSFTPVEELVGSAIGKVPGISAVAKRAPREGGLNVTAEAKSLASVFTKGMEDSARTLKTGHSELETLFGKPQLQPHELIDFIGAIHGALKAPTKRAEFERSLEKRTAHALRNGVDVTDPTVQTSLMVDAFKDAQRAIFMQDNAVVQFYKRGLTALQQPNKATGQVSAAGKAGATTLQVLLPIVKVPTNIVAETLQTAVGSITGSARLARALYRGTEKLLPEEADLIMRSLKKGSLGAALMLYGYFNADQFGGYYQPRDKDRRHPTFGTARVGGSPGEIMQAVAGTDEVPTFLLHNPLLETLQIGATIRHVADSRMKVHDRETQGLTAGIIAATLGLISEVPFVREMGEEIPKILKPEDRGKFFDYFGRDLMVPLGVQWVARAMDKDSNGNTVPRDPKTFWQTVETGIPGLRDEVPVKRRSAH